MKSIEKFQTKVFKNAGYPNDSQKIQAYTWAN